MKQTCILIIGMHRSGTSALSGVLEKLGVYLGQELMAENKFNKKGYFENNNLFKINEILLEEIDSSWQDILFNEEKLVNVKSVESLKSQIQSEFSGQPLFAIKDPRISFLFPVYKRILDELDIDIKVIISFRNPMEVASSLTKRDHFSTEKGLLLWAYHTLFAEKFSRECSRVLIDFNQLINEPKQTISLISDKLGLDLQSAYQDVQQDIITFLEPGLKHHNLSTHDLPSGTINAVRGFINNKEIINTSDQVQLFDELREELIRYQNIFYHKDILSSLQNVIRLEQDLQNAEQRVIILDGENKVSQHKAQLVEQELLVLKKALKQSEQLVAEQDTQISILEISGHDYEETITTLNLSLNAKINTNNDLNLLLEERKGQLLESEQHIYNLYSSKSWKLTKPLRYVTHFLGDKQTPCFTERTTLPTPDVLVSAALTVLPDGYDIQAYLRLNPDVQASGVDPVQHYMERGYQEGRYCTKSEAMLLPFDFDPEVYIELNPDLIDSDLDPIRHYLTTGLEEGRIYSFETIDISHGREFVLDFDTILVVSHDASRTGAPILTLNLVQNLIKQYNVVLLLLGDGDLLEDFQATGAMVLMSPDLRINQIFAEFTVNKLQSQFNFKFALVNSIESRVVLPVLSELFIPALSLIHEFATYTRPRQSFRDALFWSSEVVFSADVTMENTFAEYPDFKSCSAHILPQGRCLLPSGEHTQDEIRCEQKRIQQLIRPKGIADDTVVILGAGYVQFRKGVDLFIECANRVVESTAGKRCRFVWLGNGYEPEVDIAYSTYLADQIRRAGIEEYVFFVDATFAIETAYEEADLLLLPSRLDPLPNVAIDALTFGVPVICFDQTTGIIDFLVRSGFQDSCVARYLDPADMAKKVLALVCSDDFRATVSEKCQELSLAYFDMNQYIARLNDLALSSCLRMEQEEKDTKTILESGLFRGDFSCPPYFQDQAIETLVRGYIRGWVRNIGRRKPVPGFHPGVYLEQHGLATPGVDPFADYIRAGCPEGAWNDLVLPAHDSPVVAMENDLSVALHIHVYYLDLLVEIMDRLSCNQVLPDLFISVTCPEDQQEVHEQLGDYKGRVVDVQVVPNCGRDIGPFLTTFGSTIMGQYEFVGHLHTKKTVDVKDSKLGEMWRGFLLENLLGGESSGGMADCALLAMVDDSHVGIVFPDDPNIIGWSANRPFADGLATRLGLADLPEYFNFPIGTMFWARTSALKPFIKLNLDWYDYPEEPLPYDGTVLHALERLFPFVIQAEGFSAMVTNVKAITR